MMRSARVQVMALVCLAVAACGGGGGDGNVVSTPGGDSSPPVETVPAVQLRRVFEQLAFQQPVALKQAPSDASRWFVVEKGGAIRVFANNTNSSSSSVFLDISAIVNASGEGGLLGMAFHPDFPLTPEVYVSYTRSETPLVSYVSRFFSTDGGQTLNAGTEQALLTLSQPETNHNGGDLQFGPDGHLYIAFGDGGGGGDPRGYAQDTSNLHGTIARIDVDGADPYEIPSGNPFSQNSPCAQGFGGAACPEIFAWGLRNPWRFSFDSATGKLWAGDVGQGDWEEVDVITAGQNYGWNVREGANCYPPGSACESTFADPVAQYDHSSGDRSITGGVVYRGTAVPELVDWYVFGDFVSGRIFAIPEDAAPLAEPELLVESGLSLVSFAVDTDAELYVLDFGVGTIHRVEAAP